MILESIYEIQYPRWSDLIARETISDFGVSPSFGEFLVDSEWTVLLVRTLLLFIIS
jgi:hypothetical protein